MFCQAAICEIDKYIIEKVTTPNSAIETCSQKYPSQSLNLLSKRFILFSMCVIVCGVTISNSTIVTPIFITVNYFMKIIDPPCCG